MAKKSLLSIAPKSEFTHVVPIPTPDRLPDDVKFTFRYRNREELDAWVESLKEIDPALSSIDADILTIKGCAVGWELEDEFTDTNLRQMLQEHAGAAAVIYQTYVTVSRLGKQKN